MPITDSDETLMLRYRDGDLQAFTELYERHRHGLYRFLAWRSPRRDWVDEIAQDAWANLHAARAQYRPTAAFRTFLYQVARNRLIDVLRQKDALLEGEWAHDEASELDPPADGPSPLATLEARQQAALLHEAVRALPPDQREALVLQQFSGLGLDEIAAVTGVGMETVKSRLRYAMRKLRSQLVNTEQGEQA